MTLRAEAPAARGGPQPPASAGDRARDVRRNTLLLALAQGTSSMSSSVLLIVGSIAAVDLAGRDGIVGVMNGLYFLAAAGGALAFGRWMDRVGRRPGLALAYLLLGVAGAGCGVSIAAGSLLGLLAFATLFGLAFGGVNLARAAVADMYDAEHRGRAVGLVLACATVGAVGSPFLIAFLRSWAEREALDPSVVPWILVPIVGVIALLCALAMRRDPRGLAVAEEAAADAPRRSPSELLRVPAVRAGVLAAVVGQMAMVAVMGVTPIALEHHHASDLAISLVISLHVAGMWALSPFVGYALDKVGRRPVLLAGGILSVFGALLAGLDQGTGWASLALFAIGLGWSATYLGATAVISDATTPFERAGALGLTDLVVSLTSAGAGLAAGLLFEGAGMRALGFAVAAIVLVGVSAISRMRSPIAVSP
jgi:MFS family permease